MDSSPLVLTEQEGPVALVTLNRPDVHNALSPAMLAALSETLESLEKVSQARTIIITGNERAFAAGADIKAMAGFSSLDVIRADTLAFWQRIQRSGVPLIAAVSGYAYGGGCELALLCDLIVASETARFAQPEIKLGIMPGAGGTQRLARAIGFHRAMELILTGEPISASEAHAAGLVNRVVPVERYLDEAKALARLIASRPPVAVRLARQAVRHGVENTVREGLEVERRNYTLLFGTADQKEGIAAFLEKRQPDFKGE